MDTSRTPAPDLTHHASSSIRVSTNAALGAVEGQLTCKESLGVVLGQSGDNAQPLKEVAHAREHLFAERIDDNSNAHEKIVPEPDFGQKLDVHNPSDAGCFTRDDAGLAWLEEPPVFLHALLGVEKSSEISPPNAQVTSFNPGIKAIVSQARWHVCIFFL